MEKKKGKLKKKSVTIVLRKTREKKIDNAACRQQGGQPNVRNALRYLLGVGVRNYWYWEKVKTSFHCRLLFIATVFFLTTTDRSNYT